MTYTYTNKEQIMHKVGKKVANRLEWKIKELVQLAETIGCHLVIDYQPKDKTEFKVVVNREPEIFEQIVEVSADRIEDEERRHIINALHLTQGNIQKAAELLGISERNLHRKCKEYTIIFAKRK